MAFLPAASGHIEPATHEELIDACNDFRDQVLHGIDQFEPHEVNAVLDLFDAVIGDKLPAP